MRNIFGKLFAILATIVLLFSAAFFTVSLVLRDNNLIGTLFKKPEVRQQVEESTGISRAADMENATVALLDYMRGERANIKVGANVDGEYNDDLFSPEKEVVHMAEVQQLWITLDWFSKYGAIGAGVLLLFGFFLMQRGKRRALLSSSILWGSGIFGGILAFMGLWALLDFDSFWTVFHFIIFPQSLFQYLSAGATVEAMNELNWVLDADSFMVNILMPIFPSLVLRCAIAVILEVAATAVIAIIIHFAWRKQGKPSPVADIVVIEHDANEPIPIKGPDLVLAHKLRNAPKSKRDEIIRRAENGEPLDDAPIDYDAGETTPQSPSATAPLTQGSQEPVGDADTDVPEEPAGKGIARSSESAEEHLITACGGASPQGQRSERPQCGEERGELRPKQGVEEAQRRATTMFRDGEASDEAADEKPSPRGEGVSQSETDEVSEAAAVGSAFAEDREPCIPPSDEGGVSQRLTEGERTTPQSRQASTAPLAQGSQGRAEASDADEKPSPRGEGVSQSETDEVSISDVPEAEA